ncbi:MAG: hypothetical protein ACI4J2_10440 [Ruminococcus sp.]
MANGIMAGSGTQDSPYLVSDVYDFCAINDGETYSGNYFKLTSDIDFNDHETYKNGISAAIISRDSAIIDGDGHKICNMTFSGTAQKIKFSSINNAEFSNIIIMAVKGGTAQIKASAFTRCKFGYYLNSSNLGVVFSTGFGTFTDCTFNIGGSISAGYMNCTFNRCHINFNNLISTAYILIEYDQNISESKFVFNSTYITGSINASGIYYIFRGDGEHVAATFNNSYFACEIITNSEVLYAMSTSANMQSVCFIDKTLIPKLSSNYPEGWKLLTTEQCKDNNYLQSIGFQSFRVESE